MDLVSQLDISHYLINNLWDNLNSLHSRHNKLKCLRSHTFRCIWCRSQTTCSFGLLNGVWLHCLNNLEPLFVLLCSEMNLHGFICHKVPCTGETVILSKPWHFLLHGLVEKLVGKFWDQILVNNLVEVSLVVTSTSCLRNSFALCWLSSSSESSHCSLYLILNIIILRLLTQTLIIISQGSGLELRQMHSSGCVELVRTG